MELIAVMIVGNKLGFVEAGTRELNTYIFSTQCMYMKYIHVPILQLRESSTLHLET